ncbi:MAG: leucine-rich repeat domain-containing protein [Clostridiales bacterium]|nr:leucine-rich repeat domain-containing protein [Clostridiales bacterium]
MKRKIYLIALALVCSVLCAFGLIACGNTPDEGDNGGLSFELSEDGSFYSVFLSDKGGGENADIVIPATYRKKPVAEIKGHGFEDGKIKSVTIPDSVKKIGIQAFADCENLKTVEFGNGVTEIESFAFNNTGLETLTLPASVTTIGTQVFQANSALTTATIYGNIVCGDFLFDECPVLTKVEFLGEESISLGSEAFYDCPLLKEITIVADNVSFEDNTFFGCKPTKLTATFQAIYKADFAATMRAEAPQELVFLRTETFANEQPVSYYNNKVTSITLPATLKVCEEGAFSVFKKLEKVIYEGTVRDWCAIEFKNYSANPVSKGAELVIGGNTVEGKLIIPADVTKINEYAFFRYKKITDLEVSTGVSEIGDYAFYATSIRTVKLPEDLTAIGESALAGCRLILVTLPQNLESLGVNAFKDNHMLTRLIMTQDQIDNGMAPDYVTSLSHYFETLSEADESTVEKIGDFIFWKDENDSYWLMDYVGNEKEITLPATVNGNKYAIHAYAFANTELDKITFEDTSDWQCKYKYNAPTDMTVSDPEQNAKNLQESYVSREWYQKDN